MILFLSSDKCQIPSWASPFVECFECYIEASWKRCKFYSDCLCISETLRSRHLVIKTSKMLFKRGCWEEIKCQMQGFTDKAELYKKETYLFSTGNSVQVKNLVEAKPENQSPKFVVKMSWKYFPNLAIAWISESKALKGCLGRSSEVKVHPKWTFLQQIFKPLMSFKNCFHDKFWTLVITRV